MRKLLIYSCTLLLVCCTVTSCSSDDAYGEDASSEAKLAWIKQQYLSYCQQYGIDNISFDDRLLKKHLYFGKKDIEGDVIRLVTILEKNKNVPSTIRKKTRSLGIEMSEYGIQPILYIKGSFSKTKSKDSLEIKYTINFQGSSTGWAHLECENATVKKTKTKDSVTGMMVDSHDKREYAASAMFWSYCPNMGFQNNAGAQASYDFTYGITIGKHEQGFDFTTTYDQEVEHGYATIISQL